MRRLTHSITMAAIGAAALASPVAAQTTAQEFWTRLTALCGRAFAGTLTEGAASRPDASH